MFGGSQVADEDYLADTWMLKVQTDEHGVETVPRQYFWEQQNSRFSPHGRWSFQMATCGSRVIFCGGSTDFRVSADEMWMWSPVNRIVEIPDHPPAHLGEWTRLFGTDAIEDADWGAGGRRTQQDRRGRRVTPSLTLALSARLTLSCLPARSTSLAATFITRDLRLRRCGGGRARLRHGQMPSSRARHCRQTRRRRRASPLANGVASTASPPTWSQRFRAPISE